MHDLQGLLHAAEVDMTIFFRRLADVQIEAPSDVVAINWSRSAPRSTARRSVATTSRRSGPGSSDTRIGCAWTDRTMSAACA